MRPLLVAGAVAGVVLVAASSGEGRDFDRPARAAAAPTAERRIKVLVAAAGRMRRELHYVHARRLHHHLVYAHRSLFGTAPLPISVGATHWPANGPSSGAAVSGDNRKMRLVAFQSAASNLVPGDTNGKTDVFVWQRPRGQAGLALRHLTGTLRRASISNANLQGNGSSINPSLDGSIRTVPHCVAFQSRSTNFDRRDRSSDWDIYVHDLKSQHTYLVSAGVAGPATHPSIDGQCHKVVFQARGSIWIGSAHGLWKPSRLAPGNGARFSRDGSAIVWTHRGLVRIRRWGAVTTLGPGTNPHVSDQLNGRWGVVFDTRQRLLPADRDSHVDVYMRIIGRRGQADQTILISKVPGGDAFNGGITSYGQRRGIVTFAIRERRGWGLWYYNKHTGHVDDLAFSHHGTIQGVATSARANFVAFTTAQRISPLDRSPFTTIYFKHLVDGQSYKNAF